MSDVIAEICREWSKSGLTASMASRIPKGTLNRQLAVRLSEQENRVPRFAIHRVYLDCDFHTMLDSQVIFFQAFWVNIMREIAGDDDPVLLLPPL